MLSKAIAAAAPQLDQVFDDARLLVGAPGLAYGVVTRDGLAHHGCFGVQSVTQRTAVSVRSVFSIASMTKMITALAVLRLRDDGLLRLDDPIERYVPEVAAWPVPTQDAPPVLVRDALVHAAGWVTDDPWADRLNSLSLEEFESMLPGLRPPNQSPGLRYEYSNLGYALLGLVISRLTRMSYGAYVRQLLLGPLDMPSSSFTPDASLRSETTTGYVRLRDGSWAEQPEMEEGIFSAMGGLQTSSRDYAHLLRWMLSAWPPRDEAQSDPVSRASVRELVRGANHVRLQARPTQTGALLPALQPTQAVCYGLGVSVFTDAEFGMAFGHAGGYPGYGSYMLMFPEAGFGLFAFANVRYACLPPAIWDAASLIFRGLPDAAVSGSHAQPVSRELAHAYDAARRLWAGGSVLALAEHFAPNFLQDEDNEAWAARIAGLKLLVGDCATDSQFQPAGNLRGSFTWRGQFGLLKGTLSLSPTEPPKIQSLSLRHETLSWPSL